jgi:Sulfotransferase domain
VIDFLGIGAQKAATTWIYEHLRLHPEIRFPGGKEIHFWDLHREQGIEWWLDIFRQELGCKQGEITPAYALLELSTIREIKAIAPELRIFFSIRNPIARAWSAALMAVKRAEMEFDEASDLWFIDHFKSTGSRRRSDYLDCLRRWRSVFSGDLFQLIFFEDIIKDPAAVLVSIADHLGVNPAFYQGAELNELVRPVFPGPGHEVRPFLLNFLRVFYRQQIEGLSTELGRDFSCWLEWDGRAGFEPEPVPDLSWRRNRYGGCGALHRLNDGPSRR